MLLAFLIFLLPAVFSAVINPEDNQFDKFSDFLFVQNTILDFLPLNEHVKFMLTCSKYHQIIDAEYEELFKVVFGPEASYQMAHTSLKADIAKLWKYLRHAKFYRNSYNKFTSDNFYQMLNGLYSSDIEYLTAIKHDNLKDYMSFFGYDSRKSFGVKYIDYPHFPEMSLSLFESSPKVYTNAVIFKNACESPHLFNNFFKNFAVKCQLKRDELKEIFLSFLKIKGVDIPSHFSCHQTFMSNFSSYIARETFRICLITFLLAYQFIPAEFDNTILHAISIIILLSLRKALFHFYRMKYESFGEFNTAALRRYSIISDLQWRVFKYFFPLDAADPDNPDQFP